MVVSPGAIETVAPTSDLVTKGDLLQYELSEGPCLDSVLNQTTVISNAVAGDRRWPVWGPAASQRLGIGSMLSLLLYSDEGTYGALNLYSTQEHAYGTEEIVVAHALATHLALAISTGRELEHRATALVNRTVIGQAEGILMERYKVTPEVAFQMLRQASQVTNRRLVALAEELVRTGVLRTKP
jgi:GAF domain-containing protein